MSKAFVLSFYYGAKGNPLTLIIAQTCRYYGQRSYELNAYNDLKKQSISVPMTYVLFIVLITVKECRQN